jgi:hypothetical protein
MGLRFSSLDACVDAVETELAELRATTGGTIVAAIDRWRTDGAALRFHLNEKGTFPPLIAILGGTGTGKSTLVNRLLEGNISATSFRRTFTAGAVAIVAKATQIPPGWLGVEHRLVAAEELPAKGEPESLMVAVAPLGLAAEITLIDTPDLDGDQPLHHVQADRVFRWASKVLFLVTPEKYQMTELLPYYRLARRYEIPALFAMNKCEESIVLEDFARQLDSHFKNADGTARQQVFAVARDDAAWNPPDGADLGALRQAIVGIGPTDEGARETGLRNRATDLLGRLTDQIIGPLRESRSEADRLISVLRSMEAAEPGVDVNPITQQLQRRLQQRSVLYLMGPGRILERVRQMPAMMVRLPRTLWDSVIRGKKLDLQSPATVAADGQVPDFRANLVDQFAVVQSRMDDALRSNSAAARWLADHKAAYDVAQVNPDQAGVIVDEELGSLRDWLEKRWNATPRDTLLILRLLRHLPGGQKLVKWAEATPYLLAIIVATHHAFFGHVDLLVIGGYSLATWLTEKLSNEVTTHVRGTNRRIGERFAQLAHQQIEQLCAWVDTNVPEARTLKKLDRAAEELAEAIAGEK